MALRNVLTLGFIKNLEKVLDVLYDRAKYRLFGQVKPNTNLRFKISDYLNPPDRRSDLTLKNVFDAAAESEGFEPNRRLYASLAANTEHYMDAHCQLAKARVVNAVQSCVHSNSGDGLQAAVKKEVEAALEKARSGVKEVVESEFNRGKNMSTLDAISQMNAVLGVDDPTVYFGGPLDEHTCEECLRMCFLADRITPRVWKASELNAGYYHRGDAAPSISGFHPNCRHTLCSVVLGFGFSGGQMVYIEPGYDVWEHQRSKS